VKKKPGMVSGSTSPFHSQLIMEHHKPPEVDEVFGSTAEQKELVDIS
jgi:hypothetical protein